MKHAVVLAHPAHTSLNAAIAQTYRQTVEALGHDVLVRDLYRMRFDPRLRASEIPGPHPPQFRPDVLRERPAHTLHVGLEHLPHVVDR